MKEWDKDRELDGFLCRSSEDCMWADPNLDCQKYQIDVEFLKVTFQVFIQNPRADISNIIIPNLIGYYIVFILIT